MRSAAGIFVAGTDTGVGKSRIAAALMRALKNRGHTVLGMKPVAAGCEGSSAGLRNEDALLLQAEGSLRLPYETVNPYAFAPPIAPHLAAMEVGQSIDMAVIERNYREMERQAERVVVEGAGGWLVPLNESESLAAVPQRLGLGVVLVVGLRLGCINHALLTVEAIHASGCPLLGWVANTLDPEMARRAENIETVRARIDAPLLGVVGHRSLLDLDAVVAELSVAAI